MNKENKKLAQQKRAQERARAERKKKLAQELGFWVPVVAVIVVVIVLIWAIVTSDSTGSASENEASQTTEQTSESTENDTASDSQETATPILNTEAGLEIKEGDTVNIDFVGYMDGEAFEGGDTEGNGYDLTIGSGVFIDGFEDGLIGHTVGETVTLELAFPESYSLNPDYAGKDVTFDVTINGVYEEE